MKTIQENRPPRPTLTLLPAIALLLVVVMAAGCDRGGQSGDSAGNQAQLDQTSGDEQPLGQVTEFDGYTLRANVIRSETLPDAMARQYGIQAKPDVYLLNLVILEKQPGQQPTAVAAEVSAHYEDLIGHVETIDMRAAEADGHVSYIGTLDASAQHVFRFVIEAQPAGAEQPLPMNFEVQLRTLDSE